MMHFQALLVVHTAFTGIQIPALHEMCRETLNLLIGMSTSNLNCAGCFCIKSWFL